MNLDFLHYALIALAAFLYLRRPTTSPATPARTTPVPDLLPNNPILNAMLKSILAKIIAGVELTTREETVAQEHRTLLAAHAPGIEAAIRPAKATRARA